MSGTSMRSRKMLIMLAGIVRTYFQFASQSMCMKNKITSRALQHETAIIMAHIVPGDLCRSTSLLPTANEMRVSTHRAKNTSTYLPTPGWPCSWSVASASYPWPGLRGSKVWCSAMTGFRVQRSNSARERQHSKQIQKREEENPNQIDEVPIEAGVLEDVSLGVVEAIHQDEHEGDQADEHVQCVKAGEQEVRAGPHVAAGNHHGQVEVCVFRIMRQSVRLFLQLGQHFQAAFHSLFLDVERGQPL